MPSDDADVPNESGAARRTLAWLLICMPLAALVGRPLITGEIFAFRDAGHYYYPQFDWQDRRWRAGELPLWNPQDDLGASVTADPTASLFYPGKLLLHAAPGLDFGRRYDLYLVAHLALAAALTYGCGRAWSLRRPAAALGAVSYACGGGVLFLYSNAIYLVGAAWLPGALWAADRTARRGDRVGVLALAATLALMTLGGDPQMAIHATLVALLRTWFREPDEAEAAEANGRSPPPRPTRARAASLVVVAAVGSLALAAAQVVPSWRAAREGSRTVDETPRSVWDAFALRSRAAAAGDDAAAVPSDGAASLARGIFGPPPPGSHHRQIYDFSVGPWRLLELLVPDAFGRMFPRHARWGYAIPAEGRVWTPSLFQGLVPILCVWSGWRAMRRRPRGASAATRWLAAVGWLAALASFGGYGLGWLVRELCGDLGAPAPMNLGDPVGGIYWLFVVLLPAYAQFRYPAKWWPIAALALALLAARSLDQWLKTGEATTAHRGRRAAGVVACVAFAAATALGIAGFCGAWRAWFAHLPADDWLGPFDAERALVDTLRGTLVCAAVATLVWWMLRRVAPSADRAQRERLAWLALALAGAELVVAHRWSVVTAPPEAWRAGDETADALGDRRFYRSRGALATAPDWRRVGDDERLVDTVRQDARTLFSKMHLLHRAASVDAPVASESFAYAAWLRASRGADGLDPRTAEMLSLAATIVVDEPHAPEQPSRRELVRWSEAPLPRLRLVRDVERLEPLADHSPAAALRRAREVLERSYPSRDDRRPTVVEAPAETLAPLHAAREPSAGELAEAIRVLEERGESLRLEVDLPSPALLVVADRYDPDWQVVVRDAEGRALADARLVRACRVLRGVPLPAGRWTVEFRYRPAAVYVALAVSLAGWCAWLGLLCAGSRASSQPSPSS